MKRVPRFLLPLLAIFLLASLIHFIHNAEFLRDYPGLPKSWTRGAVYGVWLAIAAVSLLGYALVHSGWRKVGLGLMALAALGGFDSIGHYWLAPLSSHTFTMNATIFLDVGSAILLLSYIARQAFRP